MRQEKLNGRPPKEQHKKRSYQVNVKLMTEEYYYLKSQASKAAMPINDYVRSAIRSKEVRQRLIPELNLHIRELCGMANRKETTEEALVRLDESFLQKRR